MVVPNPTLQRTVKKLRFLTPVELGRWASSMNGSHRSRCHASSAASLLRASVFARACGGGGCRFAPRSALVVGSLSCGVLRVRPLAFLGRAVPEGTSDAPLQVCWLAGKRWRGFRRWCSALLSVPNPALKRTANQLRWLVPCAASPLRRSLS
jgi:hypothetical protein